MVQFAFEDGWGPANNVIDDFRALAGPKKLYLGTGGHGSANVPAERQFQQLWSDRWFDRWLKDQPNGIEDEPAMEVALQGSWRHLSLASFPPRQAAMTNYYLEGESGAGGRLAREDRVDRSEYLKRNSELQSVKPNRALRAQTLEHRPGADFTLAEFYAAGGPLLGSHGAMTRRQLDSLRYTTANLERDLVLVGIPEVQLAFTGTAAQRQVALRLWDVDRATGRRSLIARTTATSERASNEGHAVRIELSATAYRVIAGRSIELEISNLDLGWDSAKQAWRNLRAIPVFEPGKLTVHTGSWLFSLLRLPEFRTPEAE